MKVKEYHGIFGNTAVIEKTNILPYKGAPEKTPAFIVTVGADYENNLVYHVSIFETLGDAIHDVKSCGFTIKE